MIQNDQKKITNVLIKATEDELVAVAEFFEDNMSDFAWIVVDMPRISPEVAYKLKVDPSAKAMNQKPRKLDFERQKATQKEVDQFMAIGFIRDVHYPHWLSNVALVKKGNGEARICVEFMDQNKACPKDYFSLPWIYQLAETIN